jgi:hypothetical protein
MDLCVEALRKTVGSILSLLHLKELVVPAPAGSARIV